MDAPAAESELTATPPTSWLERERASGRIYRVGAIATGAILLARGHVLTPRLLIS